MLKTILEKQNPWWRDGTLKLSIFPRKITNELIKNLSNEKILALVGSRQVGKTFILYLLIKHLFKTVSPLDILYFNLEDFEIRELFSSPSIFLEAIQVKKSRKYIFIDEIQRLPTPGLFLKTLYDLHLNIKIIVSGSSQLEVKAKLKEFLVGRLRLIEVSRLSLDEIQTISPNIPKQALLESTLIYGSYPEIVKTPSLEEKKLLLHDIYQSYLQKDVADFAKIENIDAFNKLLILLAAQTGGLLNIHTLSSALNISSAKVRSYLDVLENTFIIKRLYPFFSNYKKEITKTPKIYFLDLGLRNLILGNWQELNLRSDRGTLFENLVFLEFYTKDLYKLNRYHFWRTTNQTEIDFIIEEGNAVQALEAKYASTKTPKSFKTFKKYYPKASIQLITPKNLFILKRVTGN